MTTLLTKDYTGYSNSGLDDAIGNALQEAGDYQHVEVIETRSSYRPEGSRQYQVTLTTFKE